MSNLKKAKMKESRLVLKRKRISRWEDAPSCLKFVVMSKNELSWGLNIKPV